MRFARLFLAVGLVVVVATMAATAGARLDSSQKVTTITFWHAYATNAASPELQRLTKIVIPRFEKLNPDVRVVQVPFEYGSLQQKLTTSTAGGTLPDVIRSDIAWVPQYAKLGVFAPLDKSLPGFKALAKVTYPGSLATNYYKGHYYGLPLDTNTRVEMYNAQALASAGINSPPTTFAELRAAAPKLKAKGIYAFADGGTGGWNVLPWIWSGGGALTNATFTQATGYLNSAKTIAAVDLLVDLYKAGAIPSLMTGDQGATGTEDGLATGKYATILDGPWMFPIFRSAYPNFQLKTAMVPAGPGGSVSVVGGEDIVMTQQSKHKQATGQFIKFMLSPWAQTQMAPARCRCARTRAST
jgi:multiple sugar transport system substrate-binding protein